ncbi:MAG: hypothetical protein ACFFAE_16230, partial [Candidatus Hodarchaeota archaeon]
MTLEKNIDRLKSEEGLDEILNFLQRTGINFVSKSEIRITKRLKIMAEMHGFDSYFELLNLLETDPQTRRNLIKWLERGKVFNEKENSFIPLVQRDKNQEDHLYAPKKKLSGKEKKNESFNWKNFHHDQENDTWIESDRDRKNIVSFLAHKKVKFTSKDEVRILKRLKLITRRIGFNNYSSLIKLLNSDPHTLEAVLSWLEKGRVYNEEENSFNPLVKRDNILQQGSRKITR